MMESNSDVRAVNGELDKKYNQSIDWFLNSKYYTANIPVTFLYVNEAAHLENNGLPWHDNRVISLSKDYEPGDKIIIYYANEVYLNHLSTDNKSSLEYEHDIISNFLKKRNIPKKDIILLGNTFESRGCQTQLGLLLGLSPKQILMIDYYELQTFFFHKVLGSNFNNSYNHMAKKDIRYLFGKIDKMIRIITMYELWEKGLLKNSITGCLIDYDDIDGLSLNVSNEFNNWYKKDVDPNKISMMLKQHYGSPDNVRYYYFTLKDGNQKAFNKINHCPSYPYDHNLLFTETKVSLVPETFYYNNQTHFITEKTYKTIYNNHPFTILGTAGILQVLKSKGYKTFNGICDEIYDFCSNDRKRVNLVINATNELLNTKRIEEIKSITTHNFNQLEQNALHTVDELNKLIVQNFS